MSWSTHPKFRFLDIEWLDSLIYSLKNKSHASNEDTLDQRLLHFVGFTWVKRTTLKLKAWKWRCLPAWEFLFNFFFRSLSFLVIIFFNEFWFWAISFDLPTHIFKKYPMTKNYMQTFPISNKPSWNSSQPINNKKINRNTTLDRKGRKRGRKHPKTGGGNSFICEESHLHQYEGVLVGFHPWSPDLIGWHSCWHKIGFFSQGH